MSKQTGQKEFQNMSLDQMRKLVKKEEKALKKEYSELAERKETNQKVSKNTKSKAKSKTGNKHQEKA